jgi:hypothetical protein
MTWLAKCIDGLLMMIIRAFYRQIVLVASQKTHADSILRHVIVADESCSRFRTLLDIPFLFRYFDMLLAIGGGFRT